MTLLTAHPSFFHAETLIALFVQNVTVKQDICFSTQCLWKREPSLANLSPNTAPWGMWGRRWHSQMSHSSIYCRSLNRSYAYFNFVRLALHVQACTVEKNKKAISLQTKTICIAALCVIFPFPSQSLMQEGKLS